MMPPILIRHHCFQINTTTCSSVFAFSVPYVRVQSNWTNDVKNITWVPEADSVTISACLLQWVDQPQGHPAVEQKLHHVLTTGRPLRARSANVRLWARFIFLYIFPVLCLWKPPLIYPDVPSERTCPFFPLAGSPAMSAPICHMFFPPRCTALWEF